MAVTIEPPSPTAAVYGEPPSELEAPAANAIQCSPLHPGSTALEALPSAALGEFLVAVPPGVVERRHVLAHALRVLAPDGRLVALGPKDKGGARVASELEAFGCTVSERSKARYRICETLRPDAPSGLEAAIEDGAPRSLEALGLVSQPGVFSWERLDPGSALLAGVLPKLSGRGADLGAGIGVLSLAILASPAVTALELVEIDRRALDAARRNLDDPRVGFHWADARATGLRDLDFVVSNPPFHTAGREEKSLGQGFVAAAAGMLRRGGSLWIVANRHLPYEAGLRGAFRVVRPIADESGFKIYEAVK